MAIGYVLNRSTRIWGRVICFPSIPLCKLNDNTLQGSPHLMSYQIRLLSKFREQVSPKKFVKLVKNNESEYPYIISKDMEDIITLGNPEAKIKLQGVLLLLAFMREQGQKLPEKLEPLNFMEMIESSEDEVYKLIEMYIGHSNRNTLAVKIKNDKKLNRPIKAVGSSSPYENSLLFPFSKAEQSHYYNTNLIQGLLFGQQIVFDCAFDEFMSLLELKRVAKLLNSCIRYNRRSRRPYGLNFCNMDNNGKLLRHLTLNNPAINNDLPVNVHSCSYLDLFRREDVVYLSPYVHKEFEYHPSDVYVLSAFSNKRPLCVKKARNEGVRCFKLPLGFYEMQRRSLLQVDEAFKKLLLKKNTGDCNPAKKIIKK